MKMNKSSYILAAALVAAAACNKVDINEETPGTSSEPVSGELVELTLSGVQEGLTKTFIDRDEAGFFAKWEDGDKVAVFDGGDEKRVFEIVENSGRTASFKGSILSDAKDLYVAYPADAAAAVANGKVTVTVPAVQTLGGNSTASGALVSVAKTTADAASFQFLNVVGFVKVGIALDGITEIILMGRNGEVIGGKVSVDAETGEVSEVVAGNNRISLKPAGETFSQGEYYIATLPFDFKDGFEVVLRKKSDKVLWGAIKETANQLSVARNAGKNLGTVTENLSQDWCHVIMNWEDLNTFNGKASTSTSNDLWVLGADIDYNGNNWRCANFNNATFDGRGHSIYNITCNYEYSDWSANAGFFGQTQGVTIRNLVFGSKDGKNYDGVTVMSAKSTCTKGDKPTNYLGFVGRLMQNDSGVPSRLENVANFGSVLVPEGNTCQTICGALAGRTWGASSVTGCTNNGAVDILGQTIDLDTWVGGIVGKCNDGAGVVMNNVNNGAVTVKVAYAQSIGGIVGRSSSYSLIGNVNNADVTEEIADGNGRKCLRMGGIVGHDEIGNIDNDKAADCTNNGRISSNRTTEIRLGGAIGSIELTGAKITNFVNKGAVSSVSTLDYSRVGGVCGVSWCDASVISGCTNKGTVTSVKGDVGALVGYAEGYVKDCKAGGSLNGTALTSDNYSTLIIGSVKDGSKITNNVFAE